MQALQKPNETINLSREKLLTFVSQTFGSASTQREDDEHPLPPGPWDPVIRKVAKKVFGPSPEPWHLVFGPQPEPWRSEFDMNRMILRVLATEHPEIFDVIGSRFTRVALNPQPLPPRSIFLAAFAEEAIERVSLMQEVADAMNQTGLQKGIIIVGGKLSLLVDELCGNNFKIRIPYPKPKKGESDLLSGAELLTVGAVFEQNAAVIAHEGLRNELRNAGGKLIEAGIGRMEPTSTA